MPCSDRLPPIASDPLSSSRFVTGHQCTSAESNLPSPQEEAQPQDPHQQKHRKAKPVEHTGDGLSYKNLLDKAEQLCVCLRVRVCVL